MFFNTTVILKTADDYETHCGDHFVRYINVESLCYIPETNIRPYVNYN